MNTYAHFAIETFEAPSANFRGESELNRTMLQKLTRKVGDDILTFPFISSTSIRNGFREGIALEGGTVNRSRLKTENLPMVTYAADPDPNKYNDDLIFGYLVVSDNNKELPPSWPSVLNVTHAVATTPYFGDASFHQSPGTPESSAMKTSSALFHVEQSFTAFQYGLTFCINDFGSRSIKSEIKTKDKDYVTKVFKQDANPNAYRRLLTVIGDPPKIAGNHARTLFSFEPKSLVVRITNRRTPEFDKFDPILDTAKRLSPTNLPANEFWFAGNVVEKHHGLLLDKGVPPKQMFENPSKMLEALFEQTKGCIQ